MIFNSYYKKYLNKKFAYKPKNNTKAFVLLDGFDLTYILCTRKERTMLDGEVISYNHHYYKVITDDGERKPIFKGSKLTVYENVLTNKVYVKYYNRFYDTQIIKDKITISERARITRIENQKELTQFLTNLEHD